MKQISQIQEVRKAQAILDQRRKNISEMSSQYDIHYACLKGLSNNIHKDNISHGYFSVLSEYQTIEETLKNMMINEAVLIIDEKYFTGVITNTLEESDKSHSIYNIYSGALVHDPENPIPAYQLDQIHTLNHLSDLYNTVLEKLGQEKLQTEFSGGLEECWKMAHEELLGRGLEEKDLIVEESTKFIL